MVIRNRESGFNLVELMVVVGIIGILSSVAVPRFATFKARAQQTEAKSGLNGLYLSMQAYQTNYNEFPTLASATDPASASIGFGLSGAKAKYAYLVISDPAAQSWAGTAVSNVKLANDKFDSLRTNANNWLCQMFDSVTQSAANATPTAKTAAAPKDCPQTDSGASAVVNPGLVGADTIL
jgi:prepilin-type N-terminal cleavage/methylation domain-containing protein